MIWIASSTAHSSCGLIVNPDIAVSRSSPSGVSLIVPPTMGTRLTQTQIFIGLAPDPLVRRVEQRRRPGDRDRDWILLAEVLDSQLVSHRGLISRQVCQQQVLADRWARAGAGDVGGPAG